MTNKKIYIHKIQIMIANQKDDKNNFPIAYGNRVSCSPENEINQYLNTSDE